MEVEQVKVAHNISYAEAVRRVQKVKDVTGRVQSSEQVPPHGAHPGLTVEKMILFIAYVINCTDQVKHKTEKIKIIVKGAERFFGIKGISWEHINKRLGGEGKAESSGERMT